jgi:hypothetical protein
VTDAELLGALHPTPAVGGYPKEGALEDIRALLAGLASGVYRTTEDTLDLAPEPGRTILPGEQVPLYEAAYGRYLELYPRLGG